ncbi:MAG: hypothetical protein WA946_14030, partial [Nitrospirota bacterium]
MPETVRIDIERGVILIDSSQQVGEKDLQRSLESVLQQARHHGITKVMVDATKLTSLPSIISLYGFASELSSRASNLKHAIVLAGQS